MLMHEKPCLIPIISLIKLRLRGTGEKAKQNSAKNNTKCSQSASVFNTSHGTWRMLMHEKPCLIPIISLSHGLGCMNCFADYIALDKMLFSVQKY